MAKTFKSEMTEFLCWLNTAQMFDCDSSLKNIQAIEHIKQSEAEADCSRYWSLFWHSTMN